MNTSREIVVTLVTKPGCHLCDEARPIVITTVDELRGDGVAVRVEERDTGEDADLERRFREDIPVVLIDGKRHSFWHVDAQRLRDAVLKRARRWRFGR